MLNYVNNDVNFSAYTEEFLDTERRLHGVAAVVEHVLPWV